MIGAPAQRAARDVGGTRAVRGTRAQSLETLETLAAAGTMVRAADGASRMQTGLGVNNPSDLRRRQYAGPADPPEPIGISRSRSVDPVAATDGFLARDLGQRPLPRVWEEMKRFTAGRGPDTRDEVWFVEHSAIFTLGLNGNAAHVLDAGDVPVLKVDRGGQVTYHGPGQLVAYTLLDLARLKLGVRGLVEALEWAVVDTAAEYGVEAQGRRDAPGVYVDGCKLAALGLKISRRCSYHGIALNVDMDLEPFSRINPCGFEALPVTDLKSLCGVDDIGQVRSDLERNLGIRLSGRQ